MIDGRLSRAGILSQVVLGYSTIRTVLYSLDDYMNCMEHQLVSTRGLSSHLERTRCSNPTPRVTYRVKAVHRVVNETHDPSLIVIENGGVLGQIFLPCVLFVGDVSMQEALCPPNG